MTRHETACRSCGSNRLSPVLSLGDMPLVNNLPPLEEADRVEKCPLDVVRCEECTLVQITHTVEPSRLFSKYLYLSSYSETMVGHARKLVAEVAASCSLTAENLVVEIASNDGYLLQFYREAGIQVLGIEPAENIAEIAREHRGIPTEVEFFGKECSEKLVARGLKADVIHAHNVLAHVADLNGFVQGIQTLLAERGIAVIEAPYVREMMDRVEFDTIYHEHLCYFSLTALTLLFQRHGLVIENVSIQPIHGGTLRLTVRHSGVARPDRTVDQLLAEEETWGIRRIDPYQRFRSKTEQTIAQAARLINGLAAAGRSVAAYGAAAKGVVLLNACGANAQTVAFVADRNPYKQGSAIPGTTIPIVDPSVILDHAPSDLLILPWNLAEEIAHQLEPFVAAGGRLWTLIPEPRLLSCEPDLRLAA